MASHNGKRGGNKAQSALSRVPGTGRIRFVPVVSLALICTPGFAASRSEETVAAFQAVMDAAKAIQHPSTGKGTATVVTEKIASDQLPQDVSAAKADTDSSHTTEFSMDFMFKGQLSRSTLSTIEEDGRAQPRILWAAGAKCSITYNYAGQGWAVIWRNPKTQFYRSFGYDFHPDTFMGDNRRDSRLPEVIGRLLAGPATLSARIDDSGILHLMAEYASGGTYEYRMISVDPAKGYRPIAVLEQWKLPEPAHPGSTRFTEVQWTQQDATWYVKAADWSSYEGIHSWEDKPSLPRDLLRQRVRVEITEFRPDVEIADSEFTLAGLHLPPGTRVTDRISGVNFRIGGGLQTTMLEQPLAQAEFVKRIQMSDENTTRTENTTDVNEQETGSVPQSLADEREEAVPQPIAGERDEAVARGAANPTNVRWPVFVIAFLAGIAFLLIMAQRALHVRKTS